MRGYDRTYKRVGTQNRRAESTLDTFLSFVTRPRARARASEAGCARDAIDTFCEHQGFEQRHVCVWPALETSQHSKSQN